MVISGLQYRNSDRHRGRGGRRGGAEVEERNYKDAEKTARARTLNGWATVDGDGYLYLSDRKDFMIVSGGVNIYPRI